MEIHQIFDTTAAYIGLAALIGVLLLLPLYLSQRRDVSRLRAWRELDPSYPEENIAASEQLLDRAEAELEELLGETVGVDPPPPDAATPVGGVPAATRVTHERPALERITMERAALAPHPRWRRFVSRATQPRVLVALGFVALLLGAGAIFTSQQLLSGDNATRGPHVGAIDPGAVRVTVLNGTSINGLATKVGSDVSASGYKLLATSNTTPGFAKTEVLYAKHQKPAAQKVAGDLGVKLVKPLDRATQQRAEGADVVVIAGEDRAK